MPIPYDKSLAKEINKIITIHVGAYLSDEIHNLKSAQKKQKSINKGPLYMRIAQSAYTQVLQQEDDPDTIFITPFIHEPDKKTEVALWLGLSIRFDYDIALRDFGLTSMSASFIRGSQSKQTLLRAEWDSRGDDANHAQPHWHAIPPQTVRRDAVESRWGDIQSHLHLAMCARWRSNADAGKISHAHSLHSEDVLSWLEQTLLYAKDQMSYCLLKFPTREDSIRSFTI